jgi:hypothetical protein
MKYAAETEQKEVDFMELTDAEFMKKVFSESDLSDFESQECPMPTGAFPKETPLAMAYIPVQLWENPYDADTALSRGTIFPSLDKPFIGEEAVKNAK